MQWHTKTLTHTNKHTHTRSAPSTASHNANSLGALKALSNKHNASLHGMWVSRLQVVHWMDLSVCLCVCVCMCVCEGARLCHDTPHMELPEKTMFQYGFVRTSSEGLKKDKLFTVALFTSRLVICVFTAVYLCKLRWTHEGGCDTKQTELLIVECSLICCLFCLNNYWIDCHIISDWHSQALDFNDQL